VGAAPADQAAGPQGAAGELGPDQVAVLEVVPDGTAGPAGAGPAGAGPAGADGPDRPEAPASVPPGRHFHEIGQRSSRTWNISRPNMELRTVAARTGRR